MNQAMSNLQNRIAMPPSPVSHTMIAFMTLLLLALVALSTMCLFAMEGALLAWVACMAQVIAVFVLSVYVARHNLRAHQQHRADHYLRLKIAERAGKGY
jgi:hypothetical protein